MIPAVFTAPMVICTTMLTMIEIQASLSHLLSFNRKHLIVRNFETQWEKGIIYREIQIFTELGNEAFGTYVWAYLLAQFIGGAILIQFLYVAIILRKHFIVFVLTFFVTFPITCSIYTYMLLSFHIGSMPVKYTEKILYLMGSTHEFSWSHKVASCHVIYIKVDEFHKMDRPRGPDYFRFILQRTAYLVANTELNNIIAH